MDADTPRNRDASLMRSTDHARLLLRRAQLALAGLAVPLAMLVGVVAADPTWAVITPTTAHLAYQLDPVPEPDLRPTEPGSISALARAEAIAANIAVPSETMDQRDVGLLAGLATLLVCWSLLVVAGAIWRHRLAVRDYRNWAAGWARVEPHWSDRPV